MSVNEFLQKLAPQNLLTATLDISAGGTDTEVIAAVSDRAIRVKQAIVTQKGTAAADFTVHFDGGKTVLDAIVPNDGTPVSGPDGFNFVQGERNQALQIDVEDQATDEAKLTVYYTLEGK